VILAYLPWYQTYTNFSVDTRHSYVEIGDNFKNLKWQNITAHIDVLLVSNTEHAFDLKCGAT
jgi:hypothetical protein